MDCKNNIFKYIENNNIDELEKCIKNDPRIVNIQDEEGKTLLFHTYNYDIAKYLIENGADVNIQDEEGQTRLYYAIIYEYYDIAKLLIENGADVNIQDEEEQTVLFILNNDNYDIAKLLIENGADVNHQNKYGETSLSYAVFTKSIKILNLLIENGADVNIKDEDGKTCLYYPINNNNINMAKILIKKGADVNIQDKEGKTPLFYTYNYDIAKLLIENGADVNIQDINGNTPLHFAIIKIKYNIAKLLIENGANVNIQDKNYHNSLYYALFNDVNYINDEFIKLLIKKGANFDEKYIDEIIRLILEKKYKYNDKLIYSILKLFDDENLKEKFKEKWKNNYYVIQGDQDIVNELINMTPEQKKKFENTDKYTFFNNWNKFLGIQIDLSKEYKERKEKLNLKCLEYLKENGNKEKEKLSKLYVDENNNLRDNYYYKVDAYCNQFSNNNAIKNLSNEEIDEIFRKQLDFYKTENNDNKEICTICLEKLDDGKKSISSPFKCKDKFHKECINSYEGKRCPNCGAKRLKMQFSKRKTKFSKRKTKFSGRRKKNVTKRNSKKFSKRKTKNVTKRKTKFSRKK